MQQGNKPKLRTRLPSIPSLLSPGKNKGGKQWKQAATLNGKPYTIGATPSPRAGSSLGMREAEFERMLLGGGAVTKVITLDGAARAGAQVPPAAGQPLATPVKDRGIQGPIMANRSTPNVNAVSGPLPTLSVAKPDAPPVSPASPAGGSGTAKKSRFRFPVGRENRHMIPSEYDTVDFETRLASYSDDEVNGNGAANGSGGKNAGQGKGARDKDDAWVDILVASSAKRMTGQDAELRPRVRSNNNSNGNGAAAVATRVLGRTGSGHSDPELASQEVERALAGVQAARQLSPPTDDEADEVGRMRRELAREVEVRELTPDMLNSRVRGRGRGRSRSASPQPPPSAVDDEDEDDEKYLSPALRELQQKKGRGYFDLHPDRRPALETQKTQATVGHGHGYPYSDERNTMYSEGDFEPSTSYNPSLGSAERLPDGDIEVPAFVDSNPSPGYHREIEHAKKDSMVLPALLSAGVGGGGSGRTGRTAQLIEMYREREKQGTAPAGVVPPPPVTPTRALPLAPLDTSVGDGSVLPPTAPLMLQPKPSRLPVRSSSLQNDLPTSITAKKVPSALVPGAGPPSSIPMPTQGFDLDDDEDLDDGEVDGEDGEVDEEQLMRDLNPPRPAPFVAEDLGRVSPMRYVHGAPLHNVLEEGEEEE